MGYWNKWYQRAADAKMVKIIEENYLERNLIILRYAKPERLTEQRIKQNWKNWLDNARKSNRDYFKFIVGHNYGTQECPGMAHYVFMDLEEEECRRLAQTWTWGNASVLHLDENTMGSILSYIATRQEMQRSKSSPLWGSSRKIPGKIS